ncbi:MAG: class I SAM-dependent methyltransferase [Deltaproteobacteria bacterium]|nr:class I SAM-dependent methyltransferase [Deltaproteobacteria bacterium]
MFLNEGRSEDVQKLYERYPFPHGTTKGAADMVYASTWLPHFRPEALNGRRVLEAGCGTGNKLVALAKMYPGARFVGVDLSGPSLAVAKELAEKHGRTNVELRQGNLLEISEISEYDVIQSVGVIHHLEDPQRGLDNLARALKPDGTMMIWLYHPFGEHDRLIRRELLLTLWGPDRSDLTQGEQLMKALQMTLEAGHYGPRTKASDELEGDADAFMHPIVNAYRFEEGFRMLKESGCKWVGVDFVNFRWSVKYVNLGGMTNPSAELAPPEPSAIASPQDQWMAAMRNAFDLKVSDVVPEGLTDRFQALPAREKLRAIELALKPRGFLMIAGKGQIDPSLGKRIRSNVIAL